MTIARCTHTHIRGHIMRKIGLAFLSLLVVLTLSVTGHTRAQGAAIKVVASTTIIQDIAQNVAGDKLKVDFLVPTNGDVHAFEPKPEDIRKLADANVILV